MWLSYCDANVLLTRRICPSARVPCKRVVVGIVSVSVLLHPKKYGGGKYILFPLGRLLVSTNYLTIEACLHAHIKYNEAQ